MLALMGKIFTGSGWIIKVQGAEHAPTHAHLLHPNGKAVIFLDGSVINSGVPAKIVLEAVRWVTDNSAVVVAEWQNMGNTERGKL